MSTLTAHRHVVEFRRAGTITTAVCDGCGETLLLDVHAWAEARMLEAAELADDQVIEGTLRELIDRAVNKVG